MNSATRVALGWGKKIMGMKNGIRQYGAASLTISFCAGLPDKMKLDVREVSHVECLMALRGRGDATRLMQEVCREADASDIILVLSVKPFGEHPPLDETQLEAWYTRFGFSRIQHEPVLMARMYATKALTNPQG